MTDMLHGEYTGAIPLLKGNSALLRADDKMPGVWLAQFDRIGKRKVENTPLCHSWYVFNKADFKLDD